MSIAAAEWNLGDICIRREAIKMLAPHVDAGVVFTGSMGRSYVDAYNLPTGWIATASPAMFLKRLAREAVRQDAVIVMAPGPAPLSPGIIGTAKRVAVAIGFAGVAIAGNELLVLGRALRGPSGISLAAEKIMARAAAVYTTRDATSAERVSNGSEHLPDFAFARYSPPEFHMRKYVAISLRYDREVSAVAIEEIVRKVRAANLKPIFATQVREDDAQHCNLALRLGVPVLSWGDSTSHGEQEKAIAELYKKCSAVISDRLHALLIGARHGAIPVIVDLPHESKLHASLDEFLAPQSLELWRAVEIPRLNLGDCERLRIADGMQRASNRLMELEDRIGHVLARM